MNPTKDGLRETTMTMRDLLKKTTATILAAALVAPQSAFAAVTVEGVASKPAAPAAQVQAKAQFTGVDVADDFVSVHLTGVVPYNSFLTRTPPRLVLELLDTKHAAKVRSTAGKGEFLTRVRSAQYQREPRMITRVVLDLARLAGYKVEATKTGLGIRLIGSAAAAPAPKTAAAAKPAPVAKPAPAAPKAAVAAAKPAAPKPPAKPAAKPAPKPAVKPTAVAPVVAAKAAPAPAPAAVPKPAPMPETPKSILKPIPVAVLKALETAPAPEKQAPPKRDGSAAAAFRRAGLVGHMSSELAADADASEVTPGKIDISPDDEDSGAGRRRLGGRIYSDLISRLPKDRVSLDFDNTDIRDVLKLLAAKARLNIIYGPDVAGTLTLHLSRVPFDDAFRTVLSMKGLTTDQVGSSILRVITPAALATQRTASTAITKVFPLNYAKASDVQAVIDQVRRAEGRTGSSSIDAKSNAIIVTESLEGLAATQNLIAQLDQRPRQVLIEAKLIEVNQNSGFNYGIQWDAFSQESGRIGGKQGTTLVGSAAGLVGPAVTNPLDANAIQTNVSATGGVGAGGRGTGVNLAADKIFGALTLGRITNNYLLNATITAAASEGKAKVLSDPKITTLNNQAAKINVTTQIPYVTSNVASTGVQTQTVSYATTGIELTVTPSINADGRILLVINPTVSQPSVTAAGSTQTGAPAIDSRNATTTVLVRDGETIVIGGLISDSLQDTISKIPLLGDIPILGWLFKKKTKTRVRNELLIFVTTRVLPD